jgi:hypothetical protein
MSRRTEKARVLRALRLGPVKPSDFWHPTCDGGKVISRLAARIYDLREDGYTIPPSTKADDGTAIYRLTDEPDLDLVCGDRDARENSGGPTDPADMPVSFREAAGGRTLNREDTTGMVTVTQAVAMSERTAPTAADTPASTSPSLPGAGGQLSLDDTIIIHKARPHWMDRV